MQKLHEECGVFGILNHDQAAPLTALGLHSLQHRGQDACGIISRSRSDFHTEKRTGLVRDSFFTQTGPISRLPGISAIGHVRYATCGKNDMRNIQPLFAELAGGGLALAHNGHLTNGAALRKQLIAAGAICQTSSDSEMILQLTARSRKERITEKFIDAIRDIKGGYAIVGLTKKKMIGARDPHGLRPLVLGDLDGSPVLASETCALTAVNAKFVREINRGEVLVCTKKEIKSHFPFGREPDCPFRRCAFEFVYFSRPDSVIDSKSVFEYRRNMGIELAKNTELAADMVVPIPESGTPFSIGFAEQADIPFVMAVFRNRYSTRTFIEPTPEVRELGARLKYTVQSSMIKNKKVALVDDSLVRGLTSQKLIKMVRAAGAAEVHMLVGSPPIKHCDFYGIDIPDPAELLSHNRDIEAMRKYIGADSLNFLSIDGLYRALGYPERDSKNPQLADHCFTGDYPTDF